MKNNNPNQRPKIHWYSVWQFALSALAVFYLLSGAFSLVVLGLTGLLVDLNTGAEPLALLMMAAGMIAAGLMVLPSAGYAFWRILGRKVKDTKTLSSGLRPTLLIFVFPLALILGYWVVDIPALSWLLIPPLHVLAIGLPVFWVLYLGIRDLPLGSPQRRWGVFGGGLVLGPLVILVLEALALLGFAFLGAFVIAGQPDLLQELTNLVEWMSVSGPNPDVVIDRLGPYLTRPGVILAVLAFGALIVPLIEEAFKPIGVWLLAGRDISPTEGFTAGALSGAGYALFESLAISTSSEDWVMLVVARIGTGMIHILTAAMIGWALTIAWGRNRYLTLGLTYLGAVLIHGLWNGLTLLNSYALLVEELGGSANSAPLPGLAKAAPYILGAMAVIALLALVTINRQLARTRALPSAAEELPAPAQILEKEYNPPVSAPAYAGENEGEELRNGGID